MWDDAGIVRNAQSLARAEAALAGTCTPSTGRYALPPAGRDRAFNLAWHDWLNLGSLIAVSRAIVRAARARENSRGAHYRDDYPDPGDLAASAYIRVRLHAGALACHHIPVRFTRVRPGQITAPRRMAAQGLGPVRELFHKHLINCINVQYYGWSWAVTERPDNGASSSRTPTEDRSQ